MEPPSILRIGTRGSDLALAQAALTEAALRAAFPGIVLERVVIRTTGDKRPDVRLADFSSPSADGPVVDKGIFTKELEAALRAGQIDIAVHSLKDVPTEVDPAFRVAGVLPRAPVEDVLLSRLALPQGLGSLGAGARVATSSVRRRRLLLSLRSDLRIEEIRGNVPTRLHKMFASEAAEALVLARAGLERLGWRPVEGTIETDDGELNAVVLPEATMLPAAGQGAVGFEIRAGDDHAAAAVGAINDPPTWLRVRLEREFLRLLQAGCRTPVGVSTRIEGTSLTAQAVVFADDSPESASGRASGPADNPEAVAALLLGSLQPSNVPNP